MKVLIISLCIIVSACSEKKPETKITEKKDTTKTQTIKKDTVVNKPSETNEASLKSYKTKTGKTFNVTEKKESASVSSYNISGTGFGNFSDTIKVTKKDPMVNAFTADLNNDGFEELYIITRSTGSGSNGGIIGVASNGDKNYNLINVQELKDKQLAQAGKFSGYMGHDSIYVSGGVLTREFPVYQQTDAMNNPTGGKRMVMYALKPGNNGYVLDEMNSVYMRKGK